MAKVFSRNPEMLLKLFATTMGLASAVAKLQAYQKSVIDECVKDIAYYNSLKEAYILCSHDEEMFAEEFMFISDEADEIVIGMTGENVS